MAIAAMVIVISTGASADDDYFQCTVTEALSVYDASFASDPPIEPSRTFYLATGKETPSLWRRIWGRLTPADFMAANNHDIGKVFQVNRTTGQLTGGFESSIKNEEHVILKQGGKNWPLTTIPYFELMILNHNALDAPNVTYLKIADFQERKPFILIGAGLASVILGNCK